MQPRTETSPAHRGVNRSAFLDDEHMEAEADACYNVSRLGLSAMRAKEKSLE